MRQVMTIRAIEIRLVDIAASEAHFRSTKLSCDHIAR